MKLSVVIPARDEEGTIESTVREVVRTLGSEGIDHEVLVVDDRSRDRTAAIVEALAAELEQVRYVVSHYGAGFGFTVRAGEPGGRRLRDIGATCTHGGLDQIGQGPERDVGMPGTWSGRRYGLELGCGTGRILIPVVVRKTSRHPPSSGLIVATVMCLSMPSTAP